MAERNITIVYAGIDYEPEERVIHRFEIRSQDGLHRFGWLPLDYRATALLGLAPQVIEAHREAVRVLRDFADQLELDLKDLEKAALA